MMKYLIQAKTVHGKILTFKGVDDYDIEPGNIVKLYDNKTKKTKRFHASQCDIDEDVDERRDDKYGKK